MARPASWRTISGAGIDGLILLAGLALACAIVWTALPAGDPNAGPAAALRRLREDPLDIAALRILGMDLDRGGKTAEAEALMSFIGRRTWRDGPTEIWLLRRRLGQGRLGEAFENADAILRQDSLGTTRPALFGMLTAAAGLVEARPALVARLATAPPWRTDFLQHLGAHADPANAVLVLSALAAGGAPPKPEEYALPVTRMVSGGDYSGAYDAWVLFSRRTRGAGLGDFSSPPDHTPFTWSAAEGVGATSEAETSPDGSGRMVLRIDYDGFSSPRLPARLLVSRPGRYRLAWRERGDTQMARMLYWRVRCADSGQVLARSDAMPPAPADPTGWQERGMAFEVPPTGCGGQWLELMAAPAERRDPITAWYGSMRLGASS